MTWLFCKNFGSTVPYLDCISVFDGIVILQNVPKHCSVFRLYLNIWWHGYFTKSSEAMFHIWIVPQYLMAWLFCKKFRSNVTYLDCISTFDGMVTLQKVPKQHSTFGLYLNIWWHGYFAISYKALLHIWRIIYGYLLMKISTTQKILFFVADKYLESSVKALERKRSVSGTIRYEVKRIRTIRS